MATETMQTPSVLSKFVRYGEIRAALIQRAGEMVRPRPIGTAGFFSLERVTGVAILCG